MKIPEREKLVSLVFEGLPRVDPFHLERGRLAMQQAAEATRWALEMPISEGVLRLKISALSKSPGLW